MRAIENLTIYPKVSLAQLGVQPEIDRQLGLRHSPITLAKFPDRSQGGIF